MRRPRVNALPRSTARRRRRHARRVRSPELPPPRSPHFANPIDALNLKLFHQQILRVADDDATGRWVDVDHVARFRRAAGQTLALADGEHFNPFVLAEEVALEIVDPAAMKFRFAEMGAEKCLVIIPGNKTDLLAVHLVRHLQA